MVPLAVRTSRDSTRLRMGYVDSVQRSPQHQECRAALLAEPIRWRLLLERVQIAVLAKLPDQEGVVAFLDRAPVNVEPREL